MDSRPSHTTRLHLFVVAILILVGAVPLFSAHQFPADGTVLDLDESNFDAAISSFDYILVDFYAPWCGHCKRLAPELDAAAIILARLDQPIAIAKINADKYSKLASKYDIDGYPTLKVFIHGTPTDYAGPRRSDLLVKYLRKFATPDVSIVGSDSEIHDFVDSAGTQFPIFIGFGLNESLLADFAKKYKKKAWFSVAKDFSDDTMVRFDFDKVPALVSLHPKYDHQSVFYGPFDGDFLEDFIKQNQLPLVVPINFETLKQMGDDKRRIVATFLEDEADDVAQRIVKILKAAASANRDLVFAYVGVKQWGDFTETFGINKKSELPRMLIWDGDEEYHVVEGLESLKGDPDHGSEVSHFLEAYREGRTIRKRVSGPSFMGFINSLITIKTVYLITFIVAVIMLIVHFTRLDDDGHDDDPRRSSSSSAAGSSSVSEEASKEEYHPGDKED